MRRNTVELFRADIGSPSLASQVAALRSALTPSLEPYPASRAHALYSRLVAPARSQLVGVRHLLVVPDGALQSLPFGIFVTQPPQRDPKTLEDHRAVVWLARDYAVTMLPAVSSLRALRRNARAHVAGAPFLGIGNPILAGEPATERGAARPAFRGGLGIDEVRQLPALPETADELRAIAKTLGAGEADLLLGERATEASLRATPLERYRVIEFATHGLLPGEIKGLAEPALVLTPSRTPALGDNGLLTASKIAELKLDADWVVLSACNTAIDESDPDAGGWSALAKAFLYAGARSLLVSQWPVWSKTTVTLTAGAIAELVKDPRIGRAEALRRAELAMLDPAHPAEFAHPLAWAPFVLAGEGGAGR